MTFAAAALIVTAYGLLTASLAAVAPWALPFAAAVIGAAWGLAAIAWPHIRLDAVFLALAVAGAGFVAVAGSVPAALGAVACALIAWDIAAMRRVMEPLSRGTGARARKRYVFQALGVGAACFGVGLLGLAFHPRLTFPSALALSLLAVALLAVALWQSARLHRQPAPGSGEAEPKE